VTTARAATPQLMPGGTPVLETKLVPPPGRSGIIERPAVIATMSQVTTPIVAVIAPAGYGKSTAVAQWMAQDPRPSVWLSLDARDNDPYMLLGYLHVAFDSMSPLPPDVRTAIASAAPSIWTSAMPRLGAAVAAGAPVVLVLDDYDRVVDPDGADAILSLGGHLPAGSRLVLVGRTSGRLPLPRLIADERLATIGVEDLAFDEDETVAVMRSVGVNLSATEVARVTTHLEGWPAGVYLTARAIKSGSTRSSAVDRETVRSAAADPAVATRLAGEYLRTELIDGLDDDDLAFALRTSVLEQVSGPVCDAVAGTAGSAERLRTWEQSNLLLIPLDGDHTWYRYHHLLHDVLTAELARREPSAVRGLHLRAAAWYLAEGLHEPAFEHYVTANAPDEAARLLPALLQRAWNAGRVETALRWASWFEGTPSFDRNVDALAAGSFMLRHLGEASRADRWSDTADRWHPEGDDATAAHGEALRSLGRAFGMRSGRGRRTGVVGSLVDRVRRRARRVRDLVRAGR
jgi:LuxR family maltose regulon positive regulatory protein